MIAFDICEETSKLINDFNHINFNNALSVLEWLYKALEFNSMFEDKNISDYIYNTLTAAGYKTMNNPIIELSNFTKLMQSGKNVNVMEIANSLISQVLSVIKSYYSLDPSLICLIQTFNEKFNKNFTYNYMMENLRQYIGEEVIYTGLKNNEYFIKTGRLFAVNDFKSVIIGREEVLLFEGDIILKTIQARDGKNLFNNNIKREEMPQKFKI